MITIKTKEEIEYMKKAGDIVYKTHMYLKDFIKPGITTKELNDLADDFIINKCKSYPSFKGLYGFPGTICISVNEEVVHGIPSARKLKEGDLVKLDIGASYKGYHGDSAYTYPVGKITEEEEMLLRETKKALFKGIEQVKPGNRIGDISNAIEEHAKKYNLGVVEELCGHGVGTKVHEDPNVLNYGNKNEGPILKEGMVIAIEPMLNLGTKKIYMLDDDWTIITADKRKSAHFEHTVAVTKDGYEILTGDWR